MQIVQDKMLFVVLVIVSCLSVSLAESSVANISEPSQDKLRRKQGDIENIIIAVSQSFAYLISHIKSDKTVNVDSVGATSYVNCVALLILVVLKCFTIIKKYWKNGEERGFDIASS